MTGDRHQRIQDYLEGLLSPAERAEVETLLGEDPVLRREHREMASVMSILDTPLDVEPPADLSRRIFAALEADAARRYLPARVEQVLVVGGSVALAGIVAAAGRVLGPVEPAGWIGRLALGATTALNATKEALVNAGGSLAHLDWVARLLATLSGAGRTVLETSAPSILSITALALGSAALLAYWLMRTERGAREGGLHRAGLV